MISKPFRMVQLLSNHTLKHNARQAVGESAKRLMLWTCVWYPRLTYHSRSTLLVWEDVR